MERSLEAYLNNKKKNSEAKITEEAIIELSREIANDVIDGYRCQYGENEGWNALIESISEESIAEIIKRKLS